MQRIFLFLICVFCSGCQRSSVTVVQEKIHRNLLASSFVESPDPMQYRLPRGRKLYISWRVGQEYSFEDCFLRVSMIFRNHQIKIIDFPIDGKKGTMTYSLLDEEYNETQGLLTYKVELRTKSEDIVASWMHQLWVNIIQLRDRDTRIDGNAQIQRPLFRDNIFEIR